VVCRKGGPNLLTLLMLQETLQPDVHHDIVTDDAAGRNEPRKRAIRSLFPAAFTANAHGLPQSE
jgi:hypothetical protein